MKNWKKLIVLAIFSLGGAVSAFAQDQSSAFLQAANSAYAERNYDQAIGDYLQALQGNPNSWQAYQGLGNSYYGKGDYANALANYQKSLDLNPGNTAISQFLPSVRAKAGSAPAASNVSVPRPNASMGPSDKFELDLDGALAFSTGAGYGLGFGGGAAGYVPMDKNIMIGGSAAYYTFSYNATASENSGGETVTAGGSSSASSIEFLVSGKYLLEGDKIKPYLIGGVGASIFSYSVGGGGSAGNGSEGVTETVKSSSSGVDPVLSIGGGLKMPAGPNMDVFAQAKLDLVISLSGASTSINGNNGGQTVSGTENVGGGGTFSYIPFEVGVDFNL